MEALPQKLLNRFHLFEVPGGSIATLMRSCLGNPGFQKKGYEEESAIFPPSPGKIGMLKFLVFRLARQKLKC